MDDEPIIRGSSTARIEDNLLVSENLYEESLYATNIVVRILIFLYMQKWGNRAQGEHRKHEISVENHTKREVTLRNGR